MSPYSPVCCHGWLRYPPRDSVLSQACDGGGITVSHGTAVGTCSGGRGSQIQRHWEEIVRELLSIFTHRQNTFKLPPPPLKPGPSPKHSSYIILLCHFFDTI